MNLLLDTHQHLLFSDKFVYCWTASLPELADKCFDPREYAKLVGQLDYKAIFMECAVADNDYQEETRYVSELVKRKEGNLLGVIASCRPESSGFDAWLEECSSLPVLGFRRILHVVDDKMSQSTGFIANVVKIGQQGYNFDICMRADQLGLAHILASKCPQTSFVLDHCGVPDIEGGGDFKQWQAGIARLAELDNIVCKLSGVMAYCEPGSATFATIKPYLENCLEQFGPTRVVWGSDWPVVNIRADLSTWLQVFEEFLSTLSEQEQEQICWRNANRIYKLAI